MKKIFFPILILLSFFIFGFQGQDNKSKKRTNKIDPDIVPNTVIVKMKVDPKDALLFKSDAFNKFSAILDNCKMVSFEKIFPNKKELLKSSPEKIDLSKFYILKYSEDISPYKLIQALSKNELVEYAEPKYIRKTTHSPNDYFTNNRYAQGNLKLIDAERAWDISKGSKNVIIGIVDTGVDWLHEDLAYNIWVNINEIPNNGIDDDNNGYIDDVRGWDFGGLGNDLDPTPDNDPNEDRPDHGTHVAGIASCVTNNGIGIASIGYSCSIMSVKVSQDNQRSSGGVSYIIYGFEGIVYAVDNGASIINCSWGGGNYSRFEDEVIQYANQKGAVIIAAAGNDGKFMSKFFPASYDHVMAVAGINYIYSDGLFDYRDVLLGFSNYGYYVDISAPGDNIISTWKDNNYAWCSGTSMAAPHVAGVAGLVKATYPHYTPDQIMQRVRVSADNIDYKNPLYKGLMGFGRLNAYRALTINSPAVRIISKKFEDSNGNEILEVGEKIGEKIKLIITVKNYLDPVHNLEISLSSTSSYINVNQGSFSLSGLGTLEEASNIAIPFEFEIDENASNAPFNTEAYLIINYKSGDYEDKESAFGITLNPYYLSVTTTVSKIKVTVTSEGNIGFDDYPYNEQGIGFIYDNGDNLLFEGSLMLATSANQVSDAARDNSNFAGDKNRAFQTITPIHFTNDEFSDETGFTVFNDEGAANPIGIQTTLNTYAFKNEPYNNFVILKYTYKNTNTSGTINFSSGLFLDWDLDDSYGNKHNVVEYDPSTLMGYVYTTDQFPTYVGVALLSIYDKPNFWPILNPGDDSRWGIYYGFSDEKKHQSITSGIDREFAGPGDISFVIGPGSISLDAGKDSTSYYVMVAGNNLDELRQAVAYAKQKLNNIIDIKIPESIPLEYALLGNYPNPFNPSTNIRFRLKKQGNIRIDIYDVKGSVVDIIDKKNMPAGDNTIVVNMNNRATGAYFYRFRVLNDKNEKMFEKSSKFMMIR